ncbi:MAG: hypothetical protein WBK62_07470 [Candidatus Fermentibacter daniensis]
MAHSVQLRSGASDGPRNMAVDSLLLSMAERGETGFALRTYLWEPACVSIGRLQDPSREICAERLRAGGIGAVRRPTGGRAVWHESELTYCIAACPDHFLAKCGIEEALAWTGSALADALASMGLPAVLARADRHSLHPRMPANPCFTSHGRMEVTIGGAKVVGSAQARRHGAFLEHGSMIVRNDQVRLADFLPGTDPGSREAVRAILSGTVRGLADFDPGITPESLREPVHRAFSRALGEEPVEMDEYGLDSCELTRLESSFRLEAAAWA